MKCEAMVRRVEVAKSKNKKKKVLRVTHTFSMWHLIVQRFPLNSNGPGKYNTYKKSEFKRCDGDVIAKISVEMNDGCSCCGSPNISIEYSCNKCKNTAFFELPQDEQGLSIILNDYVTGLSKSKRDILLNEKLETQLSYEEEQLKWFDRIG